MFNVAALGSACATGFLFGTVIVVILFQRLESVQLCAPTGGIMVHKFVGIAFNVLLMALVLSTTSHAEQISGSSKNMLPLCKTWLKITVDRDQAEIANILKAEPARLTNAGMCAGVVIGIAQALRVSELSCLPAGMANEQLVQTVLKEIENHPEKLDEDFAAAVSAAVIAIWTCNPTRLPSSRCWPRCFNID
jgi:hypothetical protein